MIFSTVSLINNCKTMVGETVMKEFNLNDILSDNDVKLILKKAFNIKNSEVVSSSVRPAADGLVGFLGDHLRLTLHVKTDRQTETLHLFMKRIPAGNKPKAKFIDENNYFKRESLIYQIIEETNAAQAASPWCPPVYLHSGSALVLPDLAQCGYRAWPRLRTLDLTHAMLTTAAIARFHAAFANYYTCKVTDADRPFDFNKQYELLLEEPTFCASPWLRTCAKLTADLLDEFSTKYTKRIPDLESKLSKLYLDACDSLRAEEGTLNVVVHKDLWVNNIMFKYEGGAPTGAVLIDYQCVRYAPPAFDLMSFLYLNTSRSFRETHEQDIFKHYYKIFTDSIDCQTKKRLDVLGYDEEDFLRWCERSRMFGAFDAIGIYPFVLMDARSAQRVFDDPDTFTAVVEEDRSGPVIQYARSCPEYLHRQIEVSEEFVERYVLNMY